jgi:hypothetical protein
VAEIEGEKFFELVHAVIGSFLWFIMTGQCVYSFSTPSAGLFFMLFTKIRNLPKKGVLLREDRL